MCSCGPFKNESCDGEFIECHLFLQIFETATIINYSCFGEVVLLGIQPYCMWKIDKNMKPKIRYSKENHKCKV